MSSKSTKNKPTASEVLPAESEHHEEVIHVPKGKSHLRFVLMVGLVILLLLIFAIPGAMLGATGRGSGSDEAWMSWDRPGKGRVEYTGLEFQNNKRDWADFYSIIYGGQAPQVTDEQLAGILILGALAEDAGVRVPDSEVTRFLRDYVLPRFGGVASYKAYMLNRRGYSAKRFEETLRRHLRQQTYLMLMGYLGGRPGSDDVEQAWEKLHVEAQFDFVELAIEDFADAARGELPGDEELDAWLQALPPFEASAFRQPARTSLEQLRIKLALDADGEPTADAGPLLAAFPRPEDEDPDVRSREYFDQVQFTRFRNEFPAEEDEEARRNFKPFPAYDEVAETAAAEALVWLALSDLLTDLERRANEGEELDLVSIAAEYGLEYGAAGEPWTSAEWNDDEDWGGSHLGTTLVVVPQGGYTSAPVWSGDAYVIARVAEKQEPRLELESAREAVEAAWVIERSEELALDLLGGMRDGLRDEPEDGVELDEQQKLLNSFLNPEADGATFRAAAENIGRAVQVSEWIDSADRSALPEGTAAVRLYLRTGPFGTMEAGQVPKPGTAGDPSAAFLIRVASKRPVDITAMKPADFPRFVGNASAERNMDFALDNMALAPSGAIPNFSRPVLESQFGFVMRGGDDEAEEGDEAPQ